LAVIPNSWMKKWLSSVEFKGGGKKISYQREKGEGLIRLTMGFWSVGVQGARSDMEEKGERGEGGKSGPKSLV